MDLGLAERKALVTGGGRGIGKSIAQTLATEGVEVCILSRTESELQQVCQAIADQGGKATYQVCDLADMASLTALKEHIGRVDILIHNAANVFRPKKITVMDEADWQQTIHINLNVMFSLLRLFLEDMKAQGWGRVISLASLSGVVGVGNYPAYCAAKSALEGLTKNLAVDYSRYGITVNMVSPGFIETERFQKAAPPELIEKFIAATSIKRLGKPQDVANAVAFLASNQAEYITGINLLVCGGLNLGNLW